MNAAVRQKPAHGGLQTGVHRTKVDAPDKAAQRPHQQQKQHGPRGQPGAALQQALRCAFPGRGGGHGQASSRRPARFSPTGGGLYRQLWPHSRPAASGRAAAARPPRRHGPKSGAAPAL